MDILSITKFAMIVAQSIIGQATTLASFTEMNQYDKGIVDTICQTVFDVCVAIGVTVAFCFIVIYCFRYYSRKLEFDNEKESFTKEKEKEIRETVEKELDLQKDFTSISDLIDKAKTMDIVGHEVNLIFKHGDNSLVIKTPSKPSSSNSDSNIYQPKNE